MKHTLIVAAVFILIALFFIFLFSPKNNSDGKEVERECVNDYDCVPAACCHPSSCIALDNAPFCDDIFCTQECAPGALDCGQGFCSCINGKCKAVFE